MKMANVVVIVRRFVLVALLFDYGLDAGGVIEFGYSDYGYDLRA